MLFLQSDCSHELLTKYLCLKNRFCEMFECRFKVELPDAVLTLPHFDMTVCHFQRLVGAVDFLKQITGQKLAF